MDVKENTPPPLAFGKWQEELYGDFGDDVSAGLDVALSSKYDFCPAARERSKFVAITWIDQDDSGTYDPGRRRELNPLPITKKKRERPETFDDRAPKKPRTRTWQSGRLNGSQMIVVFKLTTQDGQEWQRSVGTVHDYWSQELPETYEAQWLGSSGDSSADDAMNPYSLRKRSRPGLPTSFEFKECDLPELADIALGHPAARGCKGCFAVGEDCPLLAEGSRYPCIFCKEDEIDCELIMQPSKKRPCLGCGKGKRVCSYKQEGSDHSLPCEDCAATGIKCIAGPLSGRTRVGPSLDQGRPAVKKSCNQCLRERKWCSLKNNKKPSFPCNLCRKNEDECTLEPLKGRVPLTTRGRRTNARNPSRKASSKATEKVQEPRCKTITTKLAHPITFNYMSDNDLNPCHWCDNIVYGLLGLGEVEVEVMDRGEGKGYLEVVDGHVAAGYPPSRMCGFCALDRLRITACTRHEIEPVKGMDLDHFDHSSVKEWMMPGSATSAQFPWCSVCPAPAFFACCSVMDGMDGIDQRMEKGCGLFLCQSCAVALVNDHEGNLEGLIDRLREDEDDGFGLRADADFLHPKGELLRRMATGWD